MEWTQQKLKEMSDVSLKKNYQDRNAYFEFEESLRPNDRVLIRWTLDGEEFEHTAIVESVERRIIKASIDGFYKKGIIHYQQGHVIRVARANQNAWTINSCVLPIR